LISLQSSEIEINKATSRSVDPSKKLEGDAKHPWYVPLDLCEFSVLTQFPEHLATFKAKPKQSKKEGEEERKKERKTTCSSHPNFPRVQLCWYYISLRLNPTLSGTGLTSCLNDDDLTIYASACLDHSLV
jgi:hypothetical protein